MKKNFIPKTLSGKWAVGLGIALVVFAALSIIFAIAIGGDSAVVADSPFLTVLANVLSIMFTLAGPLSFFIGVYTIIRHREWLVCKSLTILYIITILMFLFGELIFPH